MRALAASLVALLAMGLPEGDTYLRITGADAGQGALGVPATGWRGLTAAGWTNALIQGLAILVYLEFGLRRRLEGTLNIATMAAVLTTGVYVPVIIADPGVGTLVAGHQVAVLISLVLRGRRASGEVVDLRGLDASERWLRRHASSALHLMLVSAAYTFVIAGYRLGQGPVSMWLAWVPGALAAVWAWWAWRARRADFVPWLCLVASLSLVAGLAWWRIDLAAIAGSLVVLATAISVATQLPTPRAFGAYLLRRPTLLLVLSFLAAIVVGALLLGLPAAASSASAGLSAIDALFTAASAVCVTGLIVVDTPVAFSPFGEGVLLVLIQIGGIGLMFVSTLGALALGSPLGVRGRQTLESLLDVEQPGSIYRLARFVGRFALVVELVGALALAGLFALRGVPLTEAIWKGVFHSVSAFCNAGFALWSDSLVGFADAPGVLAVHAVLIVLGGIGFAAMAAVWRSIIDRRNARVRLDTQGKTVLLVTSCLLVAGWLIYGVLEWNRSLGDLSTADKIFNALFQSVTLRTAGFNSVDYAPVASGTILMMLVWMLIGASPGGTGGGIKTTTFAVLLATIPALVRGDGRIVMMRREVAADTVTRAVAVTVLALGLTSLATFLLLLESDLPFEQVLFEATSALGTVGLSLGVTGQLDGFGKIVVIITMFFGRVGPLSLALVLGARARKAVSYPQTRVSVG